MKRIKKVIVLFLLAAMMTVMYSCNSNEKENTNNTEGKKYTLTIWGAEEDQALLKEMCNDYAKANPQNEYEFLFGVQGEGNVADSVLNDVQSGPDVYSMASDQLYKLYAGGALARIGGDIETQVKNENTAGSIDASTIKIDGVDQLYAYPCTGDNCYFVYYDKSVYKNEEDLSTLDKMLDVAEKAGKKVHFRLNDDGWYLSSFFFAVPELGYDVKYNSQMAEQKVEINYNSKQGLEVMKALRSYLYRDGLVAQTDDSKMIAALTENNGKREAAAIISGTWNAQSVKKSLGDNMGVCKLPEIKVGDETLQLSGYMGYKLIGVNGYSKNKGEAHKLAQWLSNEKNQIKRYESRGFVPTNKTATQNSNVVKDEIVKTVLEQSKYNRIQKGVPSAYWTPMGSLITPILSAKAEGRKVSDNMLQEYLDALCKQVRKG